MLNLVEELAGLGQTDVFPHMEGLPHLRDLDPEACYAWWEIVVTTSQSENAIRDIFIFVEDQAELKVVPLADRDGGAKRLGDILVDRGEVSPSDLRDALGSQKRLGEVLVEKRIVTKPQIESALVEQEHLKVDFDTCSAREPLRSPGTPRPHLCAGVEPVQMGFQGGSRGAGQDFAST